MPIPGMYSVLLMLLMLSHFCHPASSAQSTAMSSAAGIASREYSLLVYLFIYLFNLSVHSLKE